MIKPESTLETKIHKQKYNISDNVMRNDTLTQKSIMLRKMQENKIK